MALTIGQVNLPTRNHVIGNRREIVADVTLDNSYATGGYSLPYTQLGTDGAPDFVQATPFMISTTVYVPFYNYATNKLQVFTGAAEVSNATDLHLGVTRLIAHGKGSPTL